MYYLRAMYYLRYSFKRVLGYVPMLATSHSTIFLRGGRAFFLLLKSMKRGADFFQKLIMQKIRLGSQTKTNSINQSEQV